MEQEGLEHSVGDNILIFVLVSVLISFIWFM